MTTPTEYTEFTRTVAIYPKAEALEYLTLGLCSEAGEVAGKLKKLIRDDNFSYLQGSDVTVSMPDAKRLELLSETADVVWYCARLLDELGYTFEDAFEYNIQKLSSRLERNKLGGSGDNR